MMFVILICSSVKRSCLNEYRHRTSLTHADFLLYRTAPILSETSDSPEEPGLNSQNGSSGSTSRGVPCSPTTHHTTLPAVFRLATWPCSSNVRSFRRAVSREQSRVSATSPDVTTGPSTISNTSRTSSGVTVSVYRLVSPHSRDMLERLDATHTDARRKPTASAVGGIRQSTPPTTGDSQPTPPR